MYILDVAAYNSFVLFTISSPEFYKKFKLRSRRRSLEELAKGLTSELIEHRVNEMAKINFKHIKKKFYQSLKSTNVSFKKSTPNTSPIITPLSSPNSSPILIKKKGRCLHIDCTSQINRYKTRCDLCCNYVCEKHYKTTCFACLENVT